MTQPGAPTTQSRPTPLAVALGLVATGVRGARRLPFKAIQLPVLAMNSALVLREGAKREYDELAERGEAVLARLRGRAGEGVATGAFVASTAVDGVRGGVSGVVDRAQELAGDAAELAVGGAKGATRNARKAVQEGVEATADLASDLADGVEELADKVEDAAEGVADKAEGVARGVRRRGGHVDDSDGDPATTDPKGEATPARDDTPLSRPDTAASADVVAVVEQVSGELSTGRQVAHEDLPLADYDHMTLGSLRGRLRSLTLEQLVVIRDYEKAHADRLPVVTMLDNRIAKLQTEGGQPSGVPATGTADLPPSPTSKGKVGPRGAGPGDQLNVRLGDANNAQSIQRDPRR